LIPLPYTTFEDTPVLIFATHNSFYDGTVARLQIVALTDFSGAVDARGYNGSSAPAAGTEIDVVGIAMSRNLKVWEEDVAWCLPPVRTGA
jgi:hypothetical protein